MKSNAPWSVKGIERDARETAKEAAKREGMTVGEWLNHIIYTAGDPDAPGSDDREIEGLRARDLASAIEHLSRRTAGAEAKSAEAMENLARSIGGVVERVQRLERTKPVDENGAADLSARLQRLEEKSTDRQRIEALRALEKAVSQVALQFNTSHQSALSRLDSTERQLQELASRLDENGGGDSTAAVSHLKDAIDGMSARIARAERIASEAAKLKADAGGSFDTDFVEKTGARLRVLGDEIKRGGDQIRGLESSIARLAKQIDGAERRSSEGVQKVAETIAELRDQFAGADGVDNTAARAEIEAAVSAVNQRTEDRISSLQRSFDEMVRRLEAAGGAAPKPAASLLSANPPTRSSRQAEALSIDDEIEEAFASIDLDEADVDAAATSNADDGLVEEDETHDPELAGDESDPDNAFDDDFDFEFDDEATGAAESSLDADAREALADVQEAFGLAEKPPVAKQQVAEAEVEDAPLTAEFDDLVFEDEAEPADKEAPPQASDEAHIAENDVEAADVEKEEVEDIDYLKAARRAARAAAVAAAEAEKSRERKKLSPKQRAILAARLKRRKLEEQRTTQPDSETAGASPETETDAASTGDESASVQSRIKSVIARVKSRAPKATDDDHRAGAAAPAARTSEASTAGAAPAAGILGTLKTRPLMGLLLAFGAAIVLLAVALFVMTKDVLFRSDAAAPQPVAAAPVENIAPEPAAAAPVTAPQPDATLRPRDLYLESYTALKSAETDAQEQTALKGIEQAAALGHPPAQLQTGELYKIGQGYPKDLTIARQWYERAAAGGNVLAMHRLGVMSARGDGGPIDPAASIGWFEKAANFGLVDSQYNLGATYHPTGDTAANSVQDRAKAYFWYSLAAKNGDAQAGALAAGLAGDIPAAKRAAMDAEIGAWVPQTADPIANEITPAH